MQHLVVQEDSVDVEVTLYFYDTAGVGADVDHATAGLALWYRRNGAAKVSITPASLAALTTAHTDGGVEPIDDGATRLDIPDLAVATGVTKVVIGGSATGLTCIGATLILVPYDPYADLIGTPAGVSVSADIAAVKSDTAAILVDTGTTLQAELDAIEADVDAILVDTSTTLQGELDGIQATVDAILTDTGTTLQGELDGIQADTEDIQARLPAALTAAGWLKVSIQAIKDSQLTGTGPYGI